MTPSNSCANTKPAPGIPGRRLPGEALDADRAPQQEFVYWGTGSWNPRRAAQERIDAAVNAYRRHVEPIDDELGRLEAVMYIRTLYLACFGYRRALTNGSAFNEWGFIEPPEYFSSAAAAARAAFRR